MRIANWIIQALIYLVIGCAGFFVAVARPDMAVKAASWVAPLTSIPEQRLQSAVIQYASHNLSFVESLNDATRHLDVAQLSKLPSLALTASGQSDAHKVIYEFLDYNCVYCRKFEKDMQGFSPENVEIKVVQYPILAPSSLDAARVALAVGRSHPDLAAQFHHRLMSVDGPINGAIIDDTLKKLNLDPVEIHAYADSKEIKDLVQQSLDWGKNAGLSGTPSFIIGDRVKLGAGSVSDLLAQAQSVAAAQ